MQQTPIMNGRSRICLIDYLKGVCAIAVIFTHYFWTDKETPFFTLVIFKAAALCLPIFPYLYPGAVPI